MRKLRSLLVIPLLLLTSAVATNAAPFLAITNACPATAKVFVLVNDGVTGWKEFGWFNIKPGSPTHLLVNAGSSNEFKVVHDPSFSLYLYGYDLGGRGMWQGGPESVTRAFNGNSYQMQKMNINIRPNGEPIAIIECN